MGSIPAATVLAVSIANFATAAKAPKANAAQHQAEAIMKVATPGDAQKKLSAMVGKFNTEVKMWMDSRPRVAASQRTAGARRPFRQQQFPGTFMGMPFHGLGYAATTTSRRSTSARGWMTRSWTTIRTCWRFGRGTGWQAVQDDGDQRTREEVNPTVNSLEALIRSCS